MAREAYTETDTKSDTGKKSDKDKILKEGKECLDSAWIYDKGNRHEGIKDLRFLALDQWPEEIRRDREAAGRPCLTLDHLNQLKNQVVNDIRQAKISLKAVGVDDKTDQKLAEIFTALMRDIQHQSSAPHVYAMAADGAVSCGIGHMRFDTDYVEDAVFEQEIKIKHIPYPFAVYWDPAAIMPDRSDATWCFVLEFIPQRTFKKKYPKAKPVDMEVARDEDGGGLYWSTKEGVLIAEYWWKAPKKIRLAAFEDGTTLDLTDFEDADLSFLPEIVGEREVDGHQVKQCLMTGAEILDGPNDWAGRYIPIVPVIGNEIHLETKVVRSGLIRGARDGQQIYNFERTAGAECIALAPKVKWLLTDTQMGPYRNEWNDANVAPKPYLRYKPDPAAATLAPTRVAPPEPPIALWEAAHRTLDDIKAAVGIYDASLGAKSNETSGIAIARRQQEGDVSTYHFADNLSRSLEHAGRIMIDLIPKIYDTKRIIRIIGEDEEHDFIPINTPLMGVDGEPVMLNDLSQAKCDVRVAIGPSYTTKRLEAADAMIEFAKGDPAALPFIRDLIVRNQDWEGSEEMADRLKRTIPPEVLGEDEQPQQQEQPDPNAGVANELSFKDAGAKIAKTEGEARGAHADADAQEMDNAVTKRQMQDYGIPPPQHAMPPEQQPPA